VIRLADAPEAIELDTTDLLARLESQAEENGALRARAESLERVARAERDARRRLADTLKRERKAAAALHERAERERAEHRAMAAELERLRESAALNEVQVEQAWSRLKEAEYRLAHREGGFWRKLFRRDAGAG
jgi:chromosome condensin MukBEF ATPase and DNA-binding subunit MukB